MSLYNIEIIKYVMTTAKDFKVSTVNIFLITT